MKGIGFLVFGAVVAAILVVGGSLLVGFPFDWQAKTEVVTVTNPGSQTQLVPVVENSTAGSPNGMAGAPPPPPLYANQGVVPSGTVNQSVAVQDNTGTQPPAVQSDPAYVHPAASGQEAGWVNQETGGMSLGENVPLINPTPVSQSTVTTDEGTYTITVYDLAPGQNPALQGNAGSQTPPGTGAMITGKLVSQNGQSLANFQVSLGTQVRLTGESGNFSFSIPEENTGGVLFYSGTIGEQCYGGTSPVYTGQINIITAQIIDCP